MQQVLITGGCGFLGSNLINHLTVTYPDCQFHNFDRLDYCASRDNVMDHPNHHFYHGDINDSNFVMHILTYFQIDIIIHLAAQTHVDHSFDNSLQYTIDNVQGTHCLLDCAKRYGRIRRFIHMSTDEVYGEVSKDHPGCHENSILNPTNPYAATKAAAEMLVNSYWRSYQLPVIIIRANNMFGPRQYPEKLIPKFIQNLLRGENMSIHGNGETRRNFIHVDDVVRAIDIIIAKGDVGEIYNIGYENEYSVLEISRLLHEMMEIQRPWEDCVVFVQDRPFNDFRYSVNPTKLQQLGWNAVHDDFREDLKKTVEWYQSRSATAATLG